MAETDPLWQRAKADLVVLDAGGVHDTFLWEHSVRIARAAAQMLAYPELAEANVDRLALLAAALYHDAGWVIQFREHQISRWDILSRPTTDLQRELAAHWLEERGAELLPQRSLETACAAVRACNSRKAESLETQVLAESESLDEFGPLAFWRLVRRHAAEGRGIEAAIEAWNRQHEYHFWEARIKEGFRFDSVRRIARGRLSVLESFLAAIAVQHAGEDLAERVDASARQPHRNKQPR